MTKRISRPVRLQVAAAAAAGLWFFLAPITAQVQTAAPVQIAVVRYERLVLESPQGLQAQQRLQTEFAARNQALETLDTEIKGLVAQRDRDSATMSAAALATLNAQIAAKTTQLQQQGTVFNQDYQARYAEELAQLEETFRLAVGLYATLSSIDVVIADQPTLYISRRVDITEIILTRLRNP